MRLLVDVDVTICNLVSTQHHGSALTHRCCNAVARKRMLHCSPLIKQQTKQEMPPPAALTRASPSNADTL
jgi:hypothetical protein